MKWTVTGPGFGVFCGVFALAACGHPMSGPTTAIGAMPGGARTLAPEAPELAVDREGPVPYVDMLLRRRLSDPIKTTIAFCVDEQGQVVYTAIEKSSKHREFDAQVRKYFAQTLFRPYAVDSQTRRGRPVCSSGSLSFAEPHQESGTRPSHALTTRANSYLPECLRYIVDNGALVCANQTERRHDRL